MSIVVVITVTEHDALQRHFISHAPQLLFGKRKTKQQQNRTIHGHIELVACPSPQPITSSSAATVVRCGGGGSRSKDRSRTKKDCVMVKNPDTKNKKQRKNTATDRKLQIMFTIRSHVRLYRNCPCTLVLAEYFSLRHNINLQLKLYYTYKITVLIDRCNIRARELIESRIGSGSKKEKKKAKQNTERTAKRTRGERND